MRTLVIASQKGGVGKTTIAGHLGVMAEAKGAGPVALIDTDPQGSLASWWNERQAEAPVTLYQRTDYAASMIDGRTVQEIDAGSRSAAEIMELWMYLSAQIRKK